MRFETTARVWRTALGNALAVLLVVAIFGFAGVRVSPLLAVASLPFGVVSVIGLTQLQRKRKVVVTERHIEEDGKVLAKRDDVRAGYVVPARGARGCHVALKGKMAAELDVANEYQGEQLLAALGMDATHQAAEFRGVARALSLSGIVMWSICALIPLFGIAAAFSSMPWLLVVAALLAVTVPMFLIATKIRVGTDGILIQDRLSSRFYRYTDIAGIVPTQRGFSIQLTNGKAVQVPMTVRFMMVASEASQQAALLERIHEARRIAGSPYVAAATRLARSGRDVKTWLSTLVPETHAGFRDAAIPKEDLEGILDGDVPVTTRVAAAFVLARASDEGAERVRIAAGACVEPKLRVALEAAAKRASPEELEAAIAEIDDKPAAMRAG